MQNREGVNGMVSADDDPSPGVLTEMGKGGLVPTEATVPSLWDEHKTAWLAPRARGVSDFPRPTPETEDPFIIVACF